MPYTITKPEIQGDYTYRGCSIIKVQDFYHQDWYLVPEITEEKAFDTLREAKAFILHSKGILPDESGFKYQQVNPESVEPIFQKYLDQKWDQIERRFVENHPYELGVTEEGYLTKSQQELDHLYLLFSIKHPTWQNRVISSKQK